MSSEAEQTVFLIRWWQEILSGSIVILTGVLLKTRGEKVAAAVVPMTEEAITTRMTICKQDILLELNDRLDERDTKLFKHIEDQDERMLGHIKDILGAKA